MSGVIIDPTDSNNAIVNGEKAVAVRLLIGDSFDPCAPSVSDIENSVIIGYTTDLFEKGASA